MFALTNRDAVEAGGIKDSLDVWGEFANYDTDDHCNESDRCEYTVYYAELFEKI
jgi:hypothetical protein